MTEPKPADDQAATTVAGTGTSQEQIEAMAEELAAQKVRAQLSEFEKMLATQMDQQKKMFDSSQAQIEALTRQLATVRQQAGPPDAVKLAESLAGRVANIAIANPDLGALHFSGVIDQANRLHEAVKSVAAGEGDPAEAERIAHGIASWFTRAHPRVSSKFLEGMHVALDEAERIVEALPELAPVAAAVAAAI
jgi:hypothetical protein